MAFAHDVVESSPPARWKRVVIVVFGLVCVAAATALAVVLRSSVGALAAQGTVTLSLAALVLLAAGLAIIIRQRRIAAGMNRQNVAVTVVVALVVVALFEGGSYAVLRFVLRVPMERGPTADRIPRIWDRSSSYLPFGVKKDYVGVHRTEEFSTVIRTNNIGMREDVAYRGEPVDFGFVGDSMTFGWGVNAGERYSDVLREYFPTKRILSYGYIDGLAPPHYYLFFKNQPEFIPDVMVVGLYPANDLDIDLRDASMQFDVNGVPVAAAFRVRYVTDAGALGVGYDPARVHPILRPFVRSYAGKLVWLGWQQLASAQNWSRGATDPQEGPSGLDPIHLESLGYLLRLRELVASKGTRMIVFMMPPRAQFTGHPFPLWEPVQAWLRSNAFEVVDPTETFAREEDGGGQLYYPKDTHWNARGHRVAGELLAQYLVDGGLRDPEE